MNNGNTPTKKISYKSAIIEALNAVIDVNNKIKIEDSAPKTRALLVTAFGIIQGDIVSIKEVSVEEPMDIMEKINESQVKPSFHYIVNLGLKYLKELNEDQDSETYDLVYYLKDVTIQRNNRNYNVSDLLVFSDQVIGISMMSGQHVEVE